MTAATPTISALVLLHGMPRSGKDTVAEYAIEKYGYHHLKFATHLYREVAEAFEVEVADLMSHDWKTRPQIRLAPWFCRNSEFADILRGQLQVGEIPTSRRVLQTWGTEYRRSQDNDYWIRKLEADMHAAAAQGARQFVVSDLREIHEAQWAVLQTLRGVLCGPTVILELLRADARAVDIGGGRTHSTDQRLPAHFIDASIRNDGTIAALHRAADSFINPAGFGQQWNW